ncbi:L-threonine dehydrogenase [Vibrio sp. 99-8-1]|uniref:L-threonine dehydrogenase n=1 Tax=Vibrio sp. 99-8-1 TaxID=2607602 RepID=UPI001493AC7A|nr:L-threonine dehydrogenase [Vibrio sp. 99-8-1]NOI67506.1 L-threonine dehydrogenase [Vibrio sp. 99-8-1]
MSSAYFMPSVNYIGSDSLAAVITNIKSYDFKKALVVTDRVLNEIGLVKKVTDLLNENSIETIIFDAVQPNPTTRNVEEGLKALNSNECDFILSLGGGSPHDCAKGIALVKTNGGKIADYEGLDQSERPQFPLISVNTTAGTASEMTRFCIITDESRHIKMPIVDKHTTPLISVNDPELMTALPASLTAGTGMDALTHAIEAYVSIAATPITDAVALKAIELITQYLPVAVDEGENIEAREQMAYAQFMAGMAFNNASVGYVHAMAHQLGGYYDLPHGVCNAVLLPYVQEYNIQAAAKKLKDVAQAMGVNVDGMSDAEGARASVNAMKNLAEKVGIPSGLTELNVRKEDIRMLSENALKDACGLTNPKQATLKEIAEIFIKAL